LTKITVGPDITDGPALKPGFFSLKATKAEISVG